MKAIKEKIPFISFLLGIVSTMIVFSVGPSFRYGLFLGYAPFFSIPLGLIFGIIGLKSERHILAEIGIALNGLSLLAYLTLSFIG